VAFLYTGSFEAKKRSIALPSGVADPVWKLDKGTQSSGKGRIELSIWTDGRVTGTASGALGDLVIEGNAEGGDVAAGLSPTTGRGFRGVLTGRIDDRGLHGRLEAASSDAGLARQPSLELRPSPPPR
jgi:hypothetical protein